MRASSLGSRPSRAAIVRADSVDSAGRALAVAERHLETRETLLGGPFTSADAYLFWALTLMPHAGISLEPFASLRAYHERHKQRPAVRAALAFEKQQHDVPFRAGTA